jgi:NAD(P)-dependent dehydrogenase (short-subunit alcohol dehydrogenase family)
MRWTAAQLPDLTGRVAVVTGANSGIGLHTASSLAAQGAAVALACRDVSRGARAVKRILARYPDADVDVIELDLADASSVRAFAERWTTHLDLLINNAGVMAPPKRKTTRDGFELQFGTNHLGHYVLTGLLLPRLLEAPAPRVVTVSSIAHFSGERTVLDANAGPYNPQKAYSNSKLANLLFAMELQRRAESNGSALVSTAAHPGLSATGLAGSRDGIGGNPVLRVLGPVVLTAVSQPASTGARAILYAATEGAPGSYTGPQRLGQSRGAIGTAKMSTLANDQLLAARLWSLSEELTGFRYSWTVKPAQSEPRAHSASD